MINTKIKYSLDDVMIMTAPMSKIKHRGDVNTTYANGRLPIFTAPMPCVVSLKDYQYQKYLEANINPIIPRTDPFDLRLKFLDKGIFVAFSIDEFRKVFLMEYTTNIISKINPTDTKPLFVLIDVANGNMEALHNIVLYAKSIYKNRMVIMAGNVASPQSFLELCRAGCDYIRCSVGSGSGCCTATYTGVYYPMASLIDECCDIKERMFYQRVRIIADGGITTYRDAIKALALGADYVMMGSRLCQCADSAGEIVTDCDLDGNIFDQKKVYFGMASEKGCEMLGKKTGAPEGMVKKYPVLEPISIFSERFAKYLASAMSYCNAATLEDFVGKPTLNVISQNASKQFNQ